MMVVRNGSCRQTIQSLGPFGFLRTPPARPDLFALDPAGGRAYTYASSIAASGAFLPTDSMPFMQEFLAL